MSYRGYTQSQNRATQKYVREKYDRLYITVKKGIKDEIREVAGGTSINDFVNQAISEKIARLRGENH